MLLRFQTTILFVLTAMLVGIGLVMVYSASAPNQKGTSSSGAVLDRILGTPKAGTQAVATPTPVPTPILAIDRQQANATLSGRSSQSSPLDVMRRTIEVGGTGDPLSNESIEKLVEHSLHNSSGLYNQLFALCLSFFIMHFFYYWVTPDMYTIRWLNVAMVVLFVLLLAVFASAARNGAHRWINLGPLTFQPSELAKLVFTLWLACRLTLPQKLRDFTADVGPGYFRRIFSSAIWVNGAVFVAAIALIMAEPDMGGSFALACTFFAILFVNGLRWIWIFGLSGLGAVAVYYGIYFQPYRVARFTAFLDMDNPNTLSGTGYQLNQSLIALGSGGVWGKGVGAGMQKYQYLTEAQNDFIFAIIGEEFGIVGTATVLCLFALFITVGFLIANDCTKQFNKLVAVGITTMIGVSAFIHVFVTTGLAPTKGLTLPFISYGGTSLMINLMAVAILLAIAKDNEQNAPAATIEQIRKRIR